MLRRDSEKSISFCDVCRQRSFFHVGRGLLPLLAVMLLAAPQLAFAQGNLAVTIDPRSLEVEEEDTAGDSYTVHLDAEPAGKVTITVAGGEDVLTLSSRTLEFLAADWATTTLTVTVTAPEDANAVDETVTLTHTATVGDGDDAEEVTLRNGSVTVSVDDIDEKGVTVDATLNADGRFAVGEAASAQYTVVLVTQPTATVTVDIGGATGELTVNPSRLFFMPDNYNTPQPVTVYAGEDFDAESDTATLTHTIRGGDYTGVSAVPPTVPVTVTDNDARGVTVSESSLNIAAGSRATYTVMLNSQPTRTVYISATEETDNTGVTVSPASMNFSASTWNRPRTVTVTTTSGATGSVNIQHAIQMTSGRDEGYDEVTSIGQVAVTVFDAQPRVSLRPSSLSVNEGGSNNYTVRLASAPTGNVDVTVTAPAGSGLTLSGDTLSGGDLNFTEQNWNTAQTVTVAAAEDADAVQNTVMVTHLIGPNDATTTDSTLQVTIRENDTRGVTINPTSLEILEGSSGTYTVVLDSAPTDDVTVTVSGAAGDVTLVRSQLTFTTTDWFQAQEVVVNAADDADGEPDDAVTLRHTVRGGDYDRQSASSVTVTIKEDETRGIVVDTAGLPSPLIEGATGTYTVSLESQPTGVVTVMVQGASGDVTVNPSRLIFTTSDWNDSQTVEVKAGQDADGEIDAAVTLTHAASGGGYNGVTGGIVTVTTNDNDTKGVTVTPTALTVIEGAPATSYSVMLSTEPTGTVTITLGNLAVAAGQSLMVSPTSLTFNQRNWNIPQHVSVHAAEDDDGSATPVTLTHGVNGGGYAGVMARSVTVTITDNDNAGLTVTPSRLEIPQGSRRTYTVALNTKPTADVAVAITGGTADLSATPSPLNFTPDNWSTPRTVTVHANANASSATLTNTATSTDTNYNVAEDVAVVALDGDQPGVAVNPNVLSITEGSSDTYSVVLAKAPTTTVYVNIENASGDVGVNRSRLTFSTSNWNRDQMVTVSVAEDDDAVPDAAVTLTHTVTGADEYENANLNISSVTVTPNENDMRGVTVDPTGLTIGAGVSGTYRVSLNSEPTDDVTITVTSSSDDVTVSGSPLVFTTTSWGSAQNVTVMVSADAGGDELRTEMLMHSVTGGDYAGVRVSDVTVTIPVEGTPSAPRGLTATGGDQQVGLSWSAPASDGGSAIARYQYRVQQSGSGFTEWVDIPGGAGATSYTVTGLENGTSYTIEVRAVNSVGGGQGATASATLSESAPGAPANLTATGGDGQVALSWGAPSAGGSEILRYEYRYARAGAAYDDAWTTVSGAGNASSVTVTGLTNGTEYRFQVRAVNSVGDGGAAEATATPGRAPSAPTGLTARVESETITVMWGMPADTGGAAITRYEVRYRMNGNSWSNWFTIAGGANATSYTMDGLTNGIGHEIQVRAVNAIGSGPAASVEATPMEGIDFAHFANGTAGGVTITSDIVLVNVETSAVTPAIYFYNQMGDMIDADSVVDVTGDLMVNGDGVLTVPMGIPGRGEMTISTNGEGALVVGSVRVFGTGRLGGVLRFDIPAVGVAGVGASEPVNDAIFPARRMVGGINTGAAIRNLSAESMTVTCMLMQGGDVMDTVLVVLDGDGHSARFIDEMFPGANTADFVGSVRCTAPNGGMFVGVALEMDAANGIFTTLPVVPLGTGARYGESTLNFAHFANGDFGGTATSSDLVFVNVASSAVTPAVYFYDQMGNMIDASMVVDAMMEGVEVADGVLMVTDEIPSLGEMTISTSGMGDGTVGSVKVVSDGPIGGVLRFDIPNIGVAGVGASKAVNAAIFPARRMAAGINTGAAIRNLMADMTSVTCRLMMGGQRLGETVIDLAGNGQNSQFINEMFANANTDDFTGSVHCTAPSGSTFTGVALEMDFNNRIFTTLPVVPVR